VQALRQTTNIPIPDCRLQMKDRQQISFLKKEVSENICRENGLAFAVSFVIIYSVLSVFKL
jgi:hypothetical protein